MVEVRPVNVSQTPTCPVPAEEVDSEVEVGAALDDRGALCTEIIEELCCDDRDKKRASSSNRGERRSQINGRPHSGLNSRPVSRDRSSRSSSSPASSQCAGEIWRNLGCDTQAGRALRRLYGHGNPMKAASKVSYPTLSPAHDAWVPKVQPRKPCPQRASVKVPRPQRIAPDLDDPRNWRVTCGGRRPAHEIAAEIEGYRPQRPNLSKGRDQDVEKRDLQDRFRFCGGNALPKGAMGHVLPNEMPVTHDDAAQERLLDEETGMSREEREIFRELTLAVKRKKERLEELDAANEADPEPSKARTERNKEALQVQNDIQTFMIDIDKLLDLTS